MRLLELLIWNIAIFLPWSRVTADLIMQSRTYIQMYIDGSKLTAPYIHTVIPNVKSNFICSVYCNRDPNCVTFCYEPPSTDCTLLKSLVVLVPKNHDYATYIPPAGFKRCYATESFRNYFSGNNIVTKMPQMAGRGPLAPVFEGIYFLENSNTNDCFMSDPTPNPWLAIDLGPTFSGPKTLRLYFIDGAEPYMTAYLYNGPVPAAGGLAPVGSATQLVLQDTIRYSYTVIQQQYEIKESYLGQTLILWINYNPAMIPLCLVVIAD